MAAQRRARRRRIAIGVLLLFVLLVTWHVGYRLTSAGRAVRVADLSSQVSAPVADAQPGVVRLVTYNIAHGRGLAASNWDGGSSPERRLRLERIAESISDCGANVVVLNEVDFDCMWGGGVDQAEFIALRAGFPFMATQRNVDVRLPFLTVRFGNAILSRHPIRRAELVEYPVYSRIESIMAGCKLGLLVEIDMAGHGPIRVLAVHLEHRDEATRAASAKVIRDLLQQSDAPLVAAGDFNSSYPGQPFAQFDRNGRNAMSILLDEAAFATAPEALDDSAATFPVPDATRIIDWVLAGPGLVVAGVEFIDARWSDHRPVAVDIRWRSAASVAAPTDDADEGRQGATTPTTPTAR